MIFRRLSPNQHTAPDRKIIQFNDTTGTPKCVTTSFAGRSSPQMTRRGRHVTSRLYDGIACDGAYLFVHCFAASTRHPRSAAQETMSQIFTMSVSYLWRHHERNYWHWNNDSSHPTRVFKLSDHQFLFLFLLPQWATGFNPTDHRRRFRN